MLITVLVSTLAIFVYLKCKKAHKYWKGKGIRYARPWPFFGFMASNIFRFKSFPDALIYLYGTFPEQRYFGCYKFLMPYLLVRDPELIKQIMVEEFDTFPEHRPMIDPEVDPLWSKNLFTMKGGEQWRAMRSTISPAFTNSIMKSMFVLMKQCAEQFNDHFRKTNLDLVLVELKDATTRYANDIITSTALGTNCDSLENPNNEFYLAAKKITVYSLSTMLKIFGFIVHPGLMKFLKFRFFEDTVVEFYRKLVKDAISIRQEKGIIRPDMIHLLMEAQRGLLVYEESVADPSFATIEESAVGENNRKRNVKITDEDIVAQVLLFYFAGFETTSLALSYLTYELALNPEVQKRLIAEVDEAREKDDGDVTYETLMEMKYMDMVISESLRKWPPTLVTDRRSAKPFTLEQKLVWEKTVHFDEGTNCMIPIFAIHRDPKIYPKPEQFDPERFSHENKHKIKPFTYLPFGGGPRSCIGSRFAILELKTFIFHVLTTFEVVATKKTKNPLVLSKKCFQAVPDAGFWVGLKPRYNKTV